MWKDEGFVKWALLNVSIIIVLMQRFLTISVFEGVTTTFVEAIDWGLVDDGVETEFKMIFLREKVERKGEGKTKA